MRSGRGPKPGLLGGSKDRAIRSGSGGPLAALVHLSRHRLCAEARQRCRVGTGSSTYGANRAKRFFGGLGSVFLADARRGVDRSLSFGQSGHEVDRRGDDHDAQGKREPGVPQCGPPYLLGLDVGVGDLERHGRS